VVEEKKGLKSMVGRSQLSKAKFMGDEVNITKLTVVQVVEIQKLAKKLEKEAENADGMELLKLVIGYGAEGGSDLTDEEFGQFSIDELSKLSDQIMKFSGLGKDQGK
jgi:hypothetical protein